MKMSVTNCKTMLSEEQAAQPAIKKVRKSRSGPKKTGFNNIGPWQYSQKLSYLIFIFHHHDKFVTPELRRSLRIFNMMTKFIGTRTPNQCRTQHHKYIKECGNIQKIIDKSVNFPEFKQCYEKRREQLEELDLASFFGVQEELMKEGTQIKIRTKKPQQNVKIEQEMNESPTEISNKMNQNLSDSISSKTYPLTKLEETVSPNRSNHQNFFIPINFSHLYLPWVGSFPLQMYNT